MPEDQLTKSVEDVLAPAWARERRRALRHWAWPTAARVAGGLLCLWVLGLVLYLVFGLILRWTFFGFIGLLMTGAAFSQTEGREHLREGSPRG
jgi:hypothetical protein